jgi:penicillin-binding protein 2
MDLVSVVREQDFPGVNVNCLPIREYKTQYAEHVLGRTGPIFEEEYAELKEKGYAWTPSSERTAWKKALEDWLRGVDGVQTVETNTAGKITNVIDTELPDRQQLHAYH